ncbi:flagellar hook-associated protein FlgL [Salipaludibacillus aurantiacus]|uniref:Flagellar hook-associated protein 3 FlgL n=1 Tax=Salipaludibacillus aurantiacus TaxID=1601833 RepID=A0A1H9W8L9_9BACI|nr:flagellar hook-associated protein FlgL [Salipaludibacillus aurantiacus]SES30238.1 flagellar hook-associated protein 3 FlgL [Salipaludibacillus aurantiacus]
MRVTQSMIANSSLNHLSNSYQQLKKYQDQLSTGKKISRASEDPVIAMNGMRYRTQAAETSQFKRNLSEVYNWMDTADSALDKTTNTLHRLRELTVQASNDTYEAGQRANIANEVRQLKEHLESLANTQANNKYIFNSTNTTSKPVNLEAGEFSTNTENVEIELLKGVKIPVNIRPQNVFSQDLFNDIQALEDMLEDPNTTAADLSGMLNTIDTHINNSVDERAELGARVNRIEMIDDRIQEQEVIAKRILSDNEDADIEKVITGLMMQENVHRAALSSSGRIIQPTLMDFLR